MIRSLATLLILCLVSLPMPVAGESPTVAASNISIINGRQIIDIGAKGGYLPRQTLAKANMPTAIKVKTNGTFDCSSAIAIPSLGYEASLPPTGETLIDVPPQPAGSTLRGLCAMGMYSFTVQFK